MAEFQKIGHWFFGSDRVMTICAIDLAGLVLWAAPLPVIQNESNIFDLAKLEEDGMYPEDLVGLCVSVELETGTSIVCDIPDNYALFIGDNLGGASEYEDEEIVIHWSKR